MGSIFFFFFFLKGIEKSDNFLNKLGSWDSVVGSQAFIASDVSA